MSITTTLDKVTRTSIRVILQVMALLLFLPELNSSATVPIITTHDVFVVETRSGGEERDDSDAECSGGVGTTTTAVVEGMMRVVGDESVVVVVVVEGGSGCDDEEVAEANHAGHVGWCEAVVD